MQMLRNVARSKLHLKFHTINSSFVKFSRCFLSSTSNTPEVSTAKYLDDIKHDSDLPVYFENTYAEIVNNLIQEDPRSEILSEHYKKVLHYNFPCYNMIHGLPAVNAYKILTSSLPAGRQNLHMAYIMGWCIELLHAFLEVHDDIWDNSQTRREKLCWFRNEGIGMGAVNDAVMMEQGVYKMLKKYWKNEPYYMDIVELFHEASWKTSLGQCLDQLYSTSGKSGNMDHFTMDNYAIITEYKTTHGFCHLPVALAMYMAGIEDPKYHSATKNILRRIGHFLQAQNDFLDCFGNIKETGKIGNDIQEGKCTWLIVEALERSNDKQRMTLKENYGKSDDQSVSNVKTVYVDLQLPLVFTKFEDKTYRKLISLMNEPTFQLPPKIFDSFLYQLFKCKSCVKLSLW